MTTHEIYIPVAVTIRDGNVLRIAADFDGAPWMYVLEEPNAWCVETEEWEDTNRDDPTVASDAEDTAMAAISQGRQRPPSHGPSNRLRPHPRMVRVDA